MYIFHRQGGRNIFWDVFCWSDKQGYVPNDDDYKKAEKKSWRQLGLTSKNTNNLKN